MAALLVVLIVQTGLFWQGDSDREAQIVVQSGATHVLTNRILPESVLSLFASEQITIVSMSDIRYLMRYEWDADSLRLHERLEDATHYYRSYSQYLGHVHVRDPSPLWPVPPGYHVMRRKGDASLVESLPIRLHHRFDLARIQTALMEDGFIEFFPFEWLDSDHAAFVLAWLTEPDALFSIPVEEPDHASPSGVVVTLFIVVGLWLFTFAFMPSYRKSLSRYVLTHSFFVADVVYRRIRINGAMTVLWLLSATLSGLFLIVAVELLLSPHALEWIESTIFPPNDVLLFLIGFLLSLIWDGLMMLWLYATGHRTPALYLWPRHLHFGIVILLVAIAGGSPLAWMAPLLLFLFPLIWIFSFYQSLHDHGASMGSKRTRGLLLTALPHVLLTIIALQQLLQSDLWETMRMLLSLR